MDLGLRVWPLGALTQDQQNHSTLSVEVTFRVYLEARIAF